MSKFSNWSRENLEKFAQDATDKMMGQMPAEAHPNVYGYAKRLAEAIWEKHYREAAPDWRPLDDLLGVVTQIDNMTSGLVTAQPAEAKTDWRTAYREAVAMHNETLDELREAQEAEPVAWLEEAAWGRSLHLTKPDYGKTKWRAPEPKLTPLYAHYAALQQMGGEL